MFKLISDSKKLPKGAVLIELKEGKENKFIEKSGQDFLIFGVGKKNEVSHRTFFTLCRKIVRTAKSHKIEKLAIDFKDFSFSGLKNISEEEKARVIAEQFEIANFDFNKYKKDKQETKIKEVYVINAPAKLKKDFETGVLVGEEVNKARDLSNTPGGEMTPELLAKKAQEACKGTKVKITVFDEKKIKELRMGAVLGVSKGSKEKPRFILMEYKNGGTDAPIVLVGKGVTFDAGGLSLKPSDHMSDMYLDMSGGAVVIHTITAAAKLGLKKNIKALVPAVENMPSGESYRPGDILTTMSGKTVEVLNTDAEGRLILADALTYALKFKPKLVVDVATLTGAAVVALGERCSAIFTKDQKLQNLIQELGEKVGEYVWPLPLWEEYEDDIKGYFADLTNIHKDNSRYGGAIEGAIFLYQFAKKYPWVHIDMAPRMSATKNDFLSKGSTGEPLKLLLKIVEEYSGK